MPHLTPASVDLPTFGVAAALLSVERLTYVAVWHWPAWFQEACHTRWLRRLGSPVDVLMWLFVLFKIVQVVVFVAWCFVHGAGLLAPDRSAGILSAAAALLLAGQVLNLSVFRSLGRIGVFYGSRFGRHVPWRLTFPFSWLDHPQYVGTLLTIWGFFILTRYPAPDWSALPLLETVYYAFGAHFEQDRAAAPAADGGL